MKKLFVILLLLVTLNATSQNKTVVLKVSSIDANNYLTKADSLSSGYTTWLRTKKVVDSLGGRFSNYLPLTGGTLTGPLSGTSATFSSNGSFVSTGIVGYGLSVLGSSSGGVRSIFLAGQTGFSNGFTVEYDGTNMVYQMLAGNLTVAGGITLGGALNGTNATFSSSVTATSANSSPATSGTTQTASLRLAYSNGVGLDFGAYSGPPFATWIQAVDRSALGGTYPISLNPNGGNVGIGTTSPAYKLDVAGTGNFTGALNGTSATFSSRVNINGAVDDGSTALKVTGAGTFSSLAGTGSRMVVADAAGTLSATTAASTSGTYTPTISGENNCSAVTMSNVKYSSVGKVFTISGIINYTVTVGASTFSFRFSLPLSGVLNAANDLTGSINSIVSSPVYPTVGIDGYTSSSTQAQVFGTGLTGVSYSHSFIAHYIIN